MSFESDGQGPAGDEQLYEQLGRGSADHVVRHKGVVELGSGSETSQSEAEADELSDASDASGASVGSHISNSDVSQESAAESPPAADGGGPDDNIDSDNFAVHLDYDHLVDGQSHAADNNPTDLFGLAAHAVAAQNAMDARQLAQDGGPEVTEINASDVSDHSTSASSLYHTANYGQEHAINAPAAPEPEIEEPETGLRIEEIDAAEPVVGTPASSKSSLHSHEVRAPHTTLVKQTQPPVNLEEVRESVRAETRSRIRSLEAEVQRLETAEWELRRRLNDAALQTEAARAERERTAVAAAVHDTELQRLRASIEQKRLQEKSRVVELRAAVEEQRVEIEAQRRAHDVLRSRFAEQSGVLADTRAAVAELERARVELESQTSNARRAEQRTQLQLSELREELDKTLTELANARAELTLQTQTLAEVRAEARQVALAELAPASTSNEESIWRERYVELRRQMDAVASEFERREPEVLALQQEHAEAEARAAQAQDDSARALAEKNAVDRKLRAADRLATDLRMEQQLTQQQLSDLRMQVLHLLTEKMLSTSGDTPLSVEDEEELARLREQVSRESETQNGDVDGQTLISERLLLFKDVAELQFQNEALLKACRGLAKQLDPDGDAVSSAAAANQRSSSDDLREAADALEALEQKFVAVQTELDEMRRNAAASQETLSSRDSELSTVRTQLKTAESQIADLRLRLAAPEPPVSGPLQDLTLLRLELESEKARLVDTQRQLAMTQDEVSALTKRAADSQTALSRSQLKIATAESAVSQARADADQAQIALSALRSEKELWSEREQRLMSQVSAARAEAATHARDSSASQTRQADLESKLIGTMERLETLVASSAGDARVVELQEQVDVAEQRSTALQTQITGLESDLRNVQEESNSLRTRLESVLGDLEAAQNRSSQLSSELSQVRAKHEAEKANFKKRDEDLVEQVNNLEDSLTEVREKLRISEERLSSEHNASNDTRKELEAAQEVLNDVRRQLESAQKELDSERQARQESQSQGTEEDVEEQKERENRLRQEIETRVREELESSLRTETERSLRTQFDEAIKPELEKSIRSEVESALKPELERSVRSEVELSLRAELEKSLRSEVESSLRPELESQIRSELAQYSDGKKDAENNSVEQGAHVSDALRAEIEAEVRSRLAVEKTADVKPLPEDVQPLFDVLSAHAPTEEIEQFRKAVLAAEQERVKAAFRKRLEDVRLTAEDETKTKVAEAEKFAEEKAAKRAEMRTKLQTQKLTKLETRNKELESQVDELRNKVRRLKGGATDEEAPQDASGQSAGSQVQTLQQTPDHLQPFMTMPFSTLTFPSSSPFQVGSGGFPYSLDQSPKRQSFFPDNDNQKKRKESEGPYENRSQ